MDQSGIDLCLLPAAAPPDGTTTNFENPETLVPVLISICVIMTFGAVLCTTCRLFVNRRKLQWSDHFVIVALVFSLTLVGLMLGQTRFARHQWDIRACWYNGKYVKILFSQEIVLTFVLFFSKVSIFCLLYQIFQIHTFMRIAIRFGIVFAALLYFVNIPISAILSAPRVGDTWTSVLYSGRPQKELIWGVVQSALSIALDLFIFILPIPVILKLHLSGKKRIQVVAVFAIALVGVVASVLSLVYRVAAIGTNDGTWKYTSLLICSVVESDVAIIVSCAPGFAKFTRTYVAELPIIKPILLSLGRSSGSGGVSDPFSKKSSNRPPTIGQGARKRDVHEFDILDDPIEIPPSHERGGIYCGPGTDDYPFKGSSMDELVAQRPDKH